MSGFPLEAADLERFRIHARRRSRPAQVGGHLVRRRGQSLEFREFVRYTPGDDFRHIDWRASARLGRNDERLVRSFHAEEQLTLAISIDTRGSMRLPDGGSKLQVACWLARALTDIALNGNDRVVLHRLFGRASGGLARVQGSHDHERAHRYLKNLAGDESAAESNLPALLPHLPPASVWVVISDFYHGDDGTGGVDEGAVLAGGALARAVARAQSGYRWVILVELDSWPHERVKLGFGARLIAGPDSASDHLKVDLHEAELGEVEQRIRKHVDGWRKASERGGLDHDHWRWPATDEIALGPFFRDRFLSDRILEQLFMRDRG